MLTPGPGEHPQKLKTSRTKWWFSLKDESVAGRGNKHHLIDSDHVIQGVAKNSGCSFMLHDLRRTFLTVAERLALSYVVLKKLANHSGRNDTTFGYVVVDVERLREPMQRITTEFLRLCKQGKED